MAPTTILSPLLGTALAASNTHQPCDSDRAQEAQSSGAIPGLLPTFLKLDQRKVVVVGAGQLAAAKVSALLVTGARITVVAPQVSAEIEALPVTIVHRSFRARHLSGAWFVIAAATSKVNEQVRSAAERRRLFVNVVDEADQATAYFGGVVRRGDVTVAVSTSGKAPALAALLREALEGLLPDDVQRWCEIARNERLRWRAARVPISDRRPLLFEALERHYRASDHDQSRSVTPETVP